MWRRSAAAPRSSLILRSSSGASPSSASASGIGSSPAPGHWRRERSRPRSLPGQNTTCARRKRRPTRRELRNRTLHLIRQRIGRDIEIFRVAAQHQVAHATADQKGLITSFLKPVQNSQGVGGNVLARDVVVGAGNDSRREPHLTAGMSFKSDPSPLEQIERAPIIPRLFASPAEELLPSSRGLGHGPLKAGTRVRIS